MMIKSAESLKVSRTSTVDVTHEVGHEGLVSQTLSNPNHSQALTFHYFEVLQEFTITTRPTDVAPYLLVPLPLPVVTPEWVLCHECYLRRVIDCTSYLTGIDAARTLLIADRMTAIASARAAQVVAANADKSTTGDRFGGGVTAVLAAYEVMKNASFLGSKPKPGAGEGLQDAYNGLVAATKDAGSNAQKLGNAVATVVGAVAETVPHPHLP
jgi:hypothetical protein